jgi:hypothetical protein
VTEVDSYNQTVAQKRSTEREKSGKALVITGTSNPNSKRRADHRKNRKRVMESLPSSTNLPVIIDPFGVPFCRGALITPLPSNHLNLITA